LAPSTDTSACTLEALLLTADQALYGAQGKGRNQVACALVA